MKKRGKILRDPRAGQGLLIIEGRQYPFSLEGVWKSVVPPAPGVEVDVTFDHAGRMLSVTAAGESPLAEKRAQRSLRKTKAAGAEILRKIADKCGIRGRLRP
jgi:hypothetical protein